MRSGCLETDLAIIDSLAILGCGAPCAGEFGRDQLLRRMDQLGITHAIVASSLAISSDFVAGNAWLAEQIAGHRRLLGYAVVNTNHPEEAMQDMRRYLTKQQFRGLVMIEGRPDTPVSSADAEELLNAYRRFAKPLLLFTPRRECVYAAADIAPKFELIKVVLVGMGGKDWRSAIAAARQHLNIHLQTTGEVSPSRIREGWAAVNGNRMMFGSGAPMTDPAVTLGMIREAGIPERDLHKLLFSNAEKTFAG